MATLDQDILLSRARLALDATAIGQAMLEGDHDEARFRAHLLRTDAADLGFDDTAHAALRVIAHLPPGEAPKVGIGRAMLHLTDTLHIPD
jgi:hypothetical protein